VRGGVERESNDVCESKRSSSAIRDNINININTNTNTSKINAVS
jgi:hypothetical protein